ncbi:MAG: hypothetical protein HY951_02445 [Bacteroidia bacterium]|nr:hypothetical protein [Bacteroidia bacterium]
MRKVIILCVVIIVALFQNCSINNNEIHYERRLNEAKWLYYELNFKDKHVTCDQKTLYDSSICFIDGLLIDTQSIGDTFEISIFTTLSGKEKCMTYNGIFFNIFGFYPETDTVVYTGSPFITRCREPELNFSDTSWESLGVYSRIKQKELFKEFVVKNENKLNKWLKEEVKKRGYIY